MEFIPFTDKSYTITKDGEIFSYLSNRKLTGTIGKVGYRVVSLSKPVPKKLHYVHRLVAQTYLPNPHNYPQVNHKDGDKLNNHVSNLEWCSSKHNMNHAVTTGLIVSVFEENHYKSKIDCKQARDIHILWHGGASIASLSEVYNLHPNTLRQIVDGSIWKSVAKEFTPKKKQKRFTKNEIRNIHRRLQAGEDYKDIALDLGVHLSAINYIMHGKTHNDIWREFNEI